MKPAEKAKEIEIFLEAIAGRSTAIRSDMCVAPPIGCGQPICSFRNEKSKREYTLSGLCQKCQDKLFGKEEE